MLTNNLEVSGTKCWQYWPLEAGDSLVYGNFEIKTLHVEVKVDYAVSTLELRNLVVKVLNLIPSISFEIIIRNSRVKFE